LIVQLLLDHPSFVGIVWFPSQGVLEPSKPDGWRKSTAYAENLVPNDVVNESENTARRHLQLPFHLYKTSDGNVLFSFKKAPENLVRPNSPMKFLVRFRDPVDGPVVMGLLVVDLPVGE
jgi:hypothetical protein